jgi:hypothetical protein
LTCPGGVSAQQHEARLCLGDVRRGRSQERGAHSPTPCCGDHGSRPPTPNLPVAIPKFVRTRECCA